MIYLTLLRGISFGGNNKIKMDRLKLVFESLGFLNVVTYINSGNVIFEDSTFSNHDITIKIEQAIEQEFGFLVQVLVLDYNQTKSIGDNIPIDWMNNLEQKTDVLFLWKEIDYPEIINEIEHTPQVDNLIYCESAVIWNINRRQYFNGSRMNKLIGTKVYKNMTARNVNTVRKLMLLMEKING